MDGCFVNNVFGFLGIFRGVFNVKSKEINYDMFVVVVEVIVVCIK